ncbi:hypothetical protein TomMM35A_16760 [Sphingobium sp. TomMM35A]
MPQPGFLFDLLASPAEFALLENYKQVAAEADSLSLLFYQPLFDAPCLALDRPFLTSAPNPPDIRIIRSREHWMTAMRQHRLYRISLRSSVEVSIATQRPKLFERCGVID